MKLLCGLAFALFAAAADLPVDLAVPSPPVPFPAGGKTNLVYELQIWNYAAGNLPLRRIEVLSNSGVVAAWEGADLPELFYGRQDVLENGILKPGLRAVAYLWITLDPQAPVPARLRHRLIAGADSVEGAPVVVSTSKPVTIAAPLRGPNWIAANGPSNTSAHRRTVVPVDGQARIAQRYAIDWIQAGADGNFFSGPQSDNRSYHAYGAEVLAVADGVVTETRDSIPENAPSTSERAVPITLDTIGGNHIILDIGGGHYATYLHLQPGGLRVKTGQRVRRGETLGLVGNSGNSSEPHLHFQITDAGSVLGAEGVPWVLDTSGQLPMRGERVNFPVLSPGTR